MFALGLLTACEGVRHVPPSEPADARETDLGNSDLGIVDLGASPDDAGAGDLGVSPVDGGFVDAAEPLDAGGFADALEPVDAGTVADSGASIDAGSPVDAGGFVLPACLGSSLPIVFSGNSPYVDAALGAPPNQAHGAFLLDYGSTGSWVDLSQFSPTPPGTVRCGSNTCTFADFDFFGSWGSVVFNLADFSGIQSQPPQVGIIGTDFLSVTPFTLDAQNRRIFQPASGSFCSDQELENAGFAAADTAGFFRSNLADLLPLSTVVSGASGRVPNVPTIRLRVAGAEARAQIDTGFDDALVSHSININVAFFNAIQAADPGALVRRRNLDLSLSTCAGVSEPVEAWALASGRAAEWVDLQGQALQRDPGAILFVKRTPQAALVCGGIGTWTAPAAQLAGSALIRAGAMIFDPGPGRVWVPR